MMTHDDLQRFGMVMSMLCETFRRQYSEPLVEAYWGALEAFDIDDVCHAMARAVSECDRMPVPADLRRMLGVLTPQMRAARAWTAVLGAIASVGPYESVDFSDPPTHAAIRNLGGWVTLCQITDGELSYAQHRFATCYAAAMAAPEADDARHLPGTVELDNRAGGHVDWIPAPRRIAIGSGRISAPAQRLPAAHAALTGGPRT